MIIIIICIVNDALLIGSEGLEQNNQGIHFSFVSPSDKTVYKQKKEP